MTALDAAQCLLLVVNHKADAKIVIESPIVGNGKEIMKSSSALQSNKVNGSLWILAALLMSVPPLVSGGNRSLIAIGAMFLIFGIVSLRGKTSS